MGLLIKPGELVIELEEVALLRLLSDNGAGERSPGILEHFRLVIPVVLKRRGVETKLGLRSNSDQCLAVDDDQLKRLGQAHLCFNTVKEGKAKSAIALALSRNMDPRLWSNARGPWRHKAAKNSRKSEFFCHFFW